MEGLVVRKLEKETRILKWDPDEYTVEAIAKAAEVDRSGSGWPNK